MRQKHRARGENERRNQRDAPELGRPLQLRKLRRLRVRVRGWRGWFRWHHEWFGCSRGFGSVWRRRNWLDGLRQTNQQADLFGVDYEIGVHKPYAYAADLFPGQIQLK